MISNRGRGARILACAAVLAALAVAVAAVAVASDEADAAPAGVTVNKTGATDAVVSYKIDNGPWTSLQGDSASIPGVNTGNVLHLKAESTTNDQFLWWYGAVNSTASEISFTVGGDAIITAKYYMKGATNLKEVTASVTGDGKVQFQAENGAYIDFPAGGTQMFPHGSTAHLRAAASGGNTFIWWAGALSGEVRDQDLNMNESWIVSATFHSSSDIKTLTSSRTLITSGGVVPQGSIQYQQNGGWQELPATLYVPSGTSLTVKLNIGQGKFMGWGGDLASLGQTRTGVIVMSVDKSISIELMGDQTYEIEVSKKGVGDVMLRETGLYNSVPEWLNTSEYGNGNGVIEIMSVDILEYKAVGKNGYTFVYWLGDVPGNPLDPVQNIPFGAARKMTAVFSDDLVTVTATISKPYNPSCDGKVQFQLNGQWYDFPSTGELKVPKGETVQLSASEATGSVFLWWTGAITGPLRAQSLVMSADKSVTAVLNRNLPGDNLTLNVGISGPGSVSVENTGLWGAGWQAFPDSGVMTIPVSGSVISVGLRANAAGSAKFLWWTGDVVSTSPTPPSLTMSGSNKQVNATFSSNAHRVTATSSEGTISYLFEGDWTAFPSTGLYFPHGYSLKMMLEGSTTEFKEWNGVADPVQKLSLTPTLTINTDMAISAKFLMPMRTVSITNGEHGTSYPLGPIEVEHGSPLTIDFVPERGYKISDLKINGVSMMGLLTDHRLVIRGVTENLEIESQFTRGGYTITATADDGATIDPSGSLSIYYGDAQTYRFSAKPGHKITYVVVDGVEQAELEVPGQYTFAFVASNHTIEILTGDVRPMLTIEIRGTGTVEYKIGDGQYIPYSAPIALVYGASVTISAHPGEGNEFKGWWDGKINSTDEIQSLGSVHESWDVIANFGMPEPASEEAKMWGLIPLSWLWLIVAGAAIVTAICVASFITWRKIKA